MKLEFNKQEMCPTQNRATNFGKLDECKKLEAEHCCTNPSYYEVTYGHITRKWLVCNQCLELDFFKDDIKEKVRIQA